MWLRDDTKTLLFLLILTLCFQPFFALAENTSETDYKGRLLKATTTTETTKYGYDYTGQRVYLKEGTTATTTYANKFYSTSSATTTKHIYAK